MGDKRCLKFIFLQSNRSANPGTRSASLVRNVRFLQNRFGQFERAWNLRAISGISRS